MLERLQTAHYVEGRRIADEAVLLELANSIGFEAEVFRRTFTEIDVQAHFLESRALLAKVGGQGFPTLALERDGRLTLIDIGPWLGKPDAFAQWLRQAMPLHDSAPAALCGLDGCSN